MVEDTDQERIRLVQGDLAQTNEFIKGVLATGAALRGSAITIWLALLGFAVQQPLPELGLLAAVVAAVFWIADGYHGWLYGEASTHARAIEKLLSSYYDTLSRFPDDPDVLIRFRGQLRAHRHGLFTSIRARYGVGQLWAARPTLFYRYLYPFLVVVALATWALTGLGVVGSGEPPQPTHVIIDR